MPSGTNSTVNITGTKKTGKKVKSNKSDKTKPETVPEYVPDIPEPTSRAELLKYWMNLSLDDKTSNRMLWISGCKTMVRRRTQEVCPVLDRPERYECTPQVLCKEWIWNARAYWEVEYTGWVTIGVTSEGTGRRANSGPSGIGDNEDSWGLCWSGDRYQVWFNGLNTAIKDFPQCSTIGVYMDQPAGILCFYIVSGEESEKEVSLLHRVKTTAEKKMLPGFWMGVQTECTILKRPEGCAEAKTDHNACC